MLVTLTSEFVLSLKKEGDKASAICSMLNQDQAFVQAVPSAAGETVQHMAYKAEHILLHDLVTVFDSFAALYPDEDKIPVKAKFILIYFYERLQGKDLSSLYDIKKLNQLPQSDQFVKNIFTVRSVDFFQPNEKLKDEFILPSILAKIKSEQFVTIGAVINRVASFMIKADDTITAKGEELLKNIANKVNNPKIAVSQASHSSIPANDSLEIVMQELHELIGLESIKQNIEDLTNFLKVTKLRTEKGLKTSQLSLHAVFMGPPGTGKTTVARMLGRIFKHLGYVQTGHLVETDRAGMVAGYVGQTAIKADEIIKTAVGGVLFIDEAYSLTSGSYNDFGREAVEILLKRMEDQRDNLVVIIAGYSEEIEMFIQSNPGLQSRFNRYFKFDHFKPEELLKIFKAMVTKADFVLTKEAEEKLVEILERIHEKRDRSFGNARTMRNLFEKIIEQQANRIVKITPVTEELLMTIKEEDVPDVLKAVKDILLFENEDEKS